MASTHSSEQPTTGQGRSRRSAQSISTPHPLESRITRIESLIQPYEDYASSIQENVELIKEINSDFKHDRTEALEALNESVIAAGRQYVDKLKSVATSSVQMSTSRLANTLIKRLEDGDELATKYAEKLRSLMPLVGTKHSHEDNEQAEQLLPTPRKESAEAAESEVEAERPSKHRVPQTPSKRPSTRSQQLSVASEEATVVSPPSSVASAEASAPRRTGRLHKPAKRHEDFISWGEVKAEQQKRRRG